MFQNITMYSDSDEGDITDPYCDDPVWEPGHAVPADMQGTPHYSVISKIHAGVANGFVTFYQWCASGSARLRNFCNTDVY
jgi:hypothetical protein